MQLKTTLLVFFVFSCQPLLSLSPSTLRSPAPALWCSVDKQELKTKGKNALVVGAEERGGGESFARLNVFYPPMDKEVKLDTCRGIVRSIERRRWRWKKRGGGIGENDDCECELTWLSLIIPSSLISFHSLIYIQMRCLRELSIIQLSAIIGQIDWIFFLFKLTYSKCITSQIELLIERG